MSDIAPLPWFFDEGRVCDVNGDAVAFVSARLQSVTDDDQGRQCDLIAGQITSARALYEALANLLPRFERACRFAGNDDETISAATEQVRAALAQARGSIT